MSKVLRYLWETAKYTLRNEHGFFAPVVAGAAVSASTAAAAGASATMAMEGVALAGAASAAASASAAVSWGTILSGVMTAVSIAGTMVSAFGQMKAAGSKASQYTSAGESALRQAYYGKSVAEENALTMEANAKESRKTAAYNADVKRKEAFRAIADMELGYAASGVEFSSGSPLEAMLETKRNYEMDAQNIIYAGDQEAAEYNRRASLYRKSGENTLETGKESANAMFETGEAIYDAGRISTVGTILTGGKKLLSANKGIADLYA